jgi:hypothetical protein
MTQCPDCEQKDKIINELLKEIEELNEAILDANEQIDMLYD